MANVSERERLQHVAFPPEGERDFVNDVTEQLNELIGPRWISWHLDVAVPGTALFARFVKDANGRQVLTGVMLLGDAITAEQLRKVPVAALENSANLTMSPDSRQILSNEIPKLPKLERRPDMSSVEFSQLVADHYRQWAAAVPHPAAAMAAQAKVKLPTMHTWIREARLRGFLPPGRGSKATDAFRAAAEKADKLGRRMTDPARKERGK